MQNIVKKLNPWAMLGGAFAVVGYVLTIGAALLLYTLFGIPNPYLLNNISFWLMVYPFMMLANARPYEYPLMAALGLIFLPNTFNFGTPVIGIVIGVGAGSLFALLTKPALSGKVVLSLTLGGACVAILALVVLRKVAV